MQSHSQEYLFAIQKQQNRPPAQDIERLVKHIVQSGIKKFDDAAKKKITCMIEIENPQAHVNRYRIHPDHHKEKRQEAQPHYINNQVKQA